MAVLGSISTFLSCCLLILDSKLHSSLQLSCDDPATWDLCQVEFTVTDLRNDERYVRWYINWVALVTTGLIPMSTLVYFNFSIFRGKSYMYYYQTNRYFVPAAWSCGGWNCCCRGGGYFVPTLATPTLEL